MKTFAVLIAFGLTALTCFGVGLYLSPVRIEKIDSLRYCQCGYSTVQFKEGNFYMVKAHHATPAPGDLIGTYHVSGNQVAIEIFSNGKVDQATYQLDHIGLLEPNDIFYKYRGMDTRSLKTWGYFLIRRVSF